VPELSREDIREILKGSYRLIHRVTKHRVEILAVFHSARLLGDSDV
jgi:toxin ParE1/3/4